MLTWTGLGSMARITCTNSHLPLCAYYLIAARREAYIFRTYKSKLAVPVCSLLLSGLICMYVFPSHCVRDFQLKASYRAVRREDRASLGLAGGSVCLCVCVSAAQPSRCWLYGNSRFMQRENAARKCLPFPVLLEYQRRLGQLVKQANR